MYRLQAKTVHIAFICTENNTNLHHVHIVGNNCTYSNCIYRK